jgi:IMP dehydrogenase
LVSIKDLKQYESMTLANKDASGRLFVGAAVGANKDYIERAEALVKSGCDVLVVDVANGHSKIALEATEELKDRFPSIDIVSGSVATG